MTAREPVTSLDERYGDVATPVAWAGARQVLAEAELYWLTTVRPDGRPHVTPLIAVWFDDALHLCTGPDERKAGNLAQNPQCAVTTGRNSLRDGLDLVVEGRAERLVDDAALHRLADAYVAKYGEDWHFTVADGAFIHQGGTSLVFRVAHSTIFGFGKNPYSQTRWKFGEVS